MRTYQAFAIGLALVAATSAQSQNSAGLAKIDNNSARLERYRNLDFDKVENVYLRCLNSDNQGIVESAIGVVTYMRAAFPDRKMSEIRAKLVDLASSSSSHSVRAKAFLAMKVFADPTAYKKIAESSDSGSWPFDDLAAK